MPAVVAWRCPKPSLYLPFSNRLNLPVVLVHSPIRALDIAMMTAAGLGGVEASIRIQPQAFSLFTNVSNWSTKAVLDRHGHVLRDSHVS